MIARGPSPAVRKMVHDGGLLVALAGLVLFLLGLDSPSGTTTVVGILLVPVGVAMIWLSSRRPRSPVPATLPPA